MSYVSPSTRRVIKAVLFDTFGSVVDWRSGVARDLAAFAKRHRIDLDAVAFADAWRAKYEPSMEPVRNGSREFVPLDQLHLENLHATLAEFGLDPADFDDRDLADLNAAWERLDPWEDSAAGLAELRQTCDRRTAVERQSRPAAADGAAGETALDRDRRFGCDPGLQADHGGVSEHGVDAYGWIPARSCSRQPTTATSRLRQRAGLGTAFIPRPDRARREVRPTDLTAEGDWDLVCANILELAAAGSPTHEAAHHSPRIRRTALAAELRLGQQR